MSETKNMEIVLVANEKGGAGKTSTCLCLANALTAIGYKVLVVDMDPSGNLSAAALPDVPKYVLWDVFRGNCDVSDAIVHTDIADILPTIKDMPNNAPSPARKKFVIQERKSLRDLFATIYGMEGSEKFLSSLLRESGFEKNYDFILIDTPPSDDLIVTNGIVASDTCVVPVEPNLASSDGLRMFFASINAAHAAYGAHVALDGIVFTRFTDDWQTRKKQIEALTEEMEGAGIYLYKTRFRNSPSIETAMNECRPILEYMYRGPGATDSMNFCLEFLAKRGLKPRVMYPGVFLDEKGQYIFRKNGDKYFTFQNDNGNVSIAQKHFRKENLDDPAWCQRIGKDIFFSAENIQEALSNQGISWLTVDQNNAN